MNHMTPVLPIYLERFDPTQQMARFYSIGIEPTLFGDWAMVCQWGRIGTLGQRQSQGFTTHAAATAAAHAVLTRKRHRGYRTPAERDTAPIPAAAGPAKPIRTTPANRSQYELDLD